MKSDDWKLKIYATIHRIYKKAPFLFRAKTYSYEVYSGGGDGLPKTILLKVRAKTKLEGLYYIQNIEHSVLSNPVFTNVEPDKHIRILNKYVQIGRGLTIEEEHEEQKSISDFFEELIKQ